MSTTTTGKEDCLPIRKKRNDAPRGEKETESQLLKNEHDNSLLAVVGSRQTPRKTTMCTMMMDMDMDIDDASSPTFTESTTSCSPYSHAITPSPSPSPSPNPADADTDTDTRDSLILAVSDTERSGFEDLLTKPDIVRTLDFSGKTAHHPREQEEKKDDSVPIPHCSLSANLGDIEVKSSFFLDEYEVIVPSLTRISSTIFSPGDHDGKAAAVFIENGDYGWLPARIIEERDEVAVVRVQWPDHATTSIINQCQDQPAIITVNYGEYPERCLPVQNEKAKRDMVDLVYLHEAAILYNLKQRHAELQPYTRVGDILVAMNPFQWIDALYTPERQQEYIRRLLGKDLTIENGLFDYKDRFDRLDMEPHVYEISTLAYRGLVCEGKDQTILVTGDSGAGKTETVKILMSHLATIPKNSAIDIVTRVCQSSPIFEAFGNAKTLKNNNSSRFGKFIQMQFELQDSHADMIGSFCTTYLLEKTRVVSHASGERSYHIFYQLLAAPTEFKERLWPFFPAFQAGDFSYLNHSGTIDSHTHSDQEKWTETSKALSLFQCDGDSLFELMRALAITLQLGNLVFEGVVTENHGEEYNTKITSHDQLAQLSEMTGISSHKLEETMTCKVLKTGSEIVKVNASPQVAKEWCDAFAKEIYARIFDMIVRKMNASTAASKQQTKNIGHISLLDIFGFERFEINRFEQMCINYANEKLHNKYVDDNFNQIKEEYAFEGVDLYDFSLVDNSNILELLEDRGGIISALNEESHLPNGSNTSFVSKVKTNHSKRSSFLLHRLQNRTEFGLRHFAGHVVYNAEKFLERNMDKLPEGIVACAANSTNAVIKEQFSKSRAEPELSSRRASLKKNKFVLEKFQTQLKGLMSALSDSQTRYIRCIKPNTEFCPRKTDNLATLQQLECSGIMTAIAITRDGYPDRLPYGILQDRFACLMRERDFKKVGGMDFRDKTEYILSKRLQPYQFRCGKTKVFFKAGAKEQLEVLRLDYFHKNAVLIQTAVRRVQTIDHFATAMKMVLTVQTFWRMAIVRMQFKRQQHSATRLSVFLRKCLAIRRAANLRSYIAATRIQSQIRTKGCIRELRQGRDAAISIQVSVRRIQAKKRATTFLLAIVAIQSCSRMRRQYVLFNLKKGYATAIMAWYRGTQARKSVAKMRLHHKAATSLQRATRCLLREKHDRATKIQRTYRQHNLDKKNSAAGIIQQKYRSYLQSQSISKKPRTLEKLFYWMDSVCCPKF